MELFKINELRQYKFIQVPQELIYNPRYKGLSSDAKLLYGLLLDRMELSRENNWVNENGEIYLIFTRENIQNILQISDKTCTKAFKQLSKAELIKEKKQGLGNPNLIYIGHMVYDDPETLENTKNRKNYDSATVKITIQQPYNLRPNKTNINNTNTNIEEEETTHGVAIDQDIFNTYRSCISNRVSDMELMTLAELQQESGKELLRKAIILAAMKNGKNLSYIQAILQDWREKGLLTIEQVNIYLTKWVAMNRKSKENRIKQTKRRAENQDSNTKVSSFNNYTQRTYDFDKLEKELLGWEENY